MNQTKEEKTVKTFKELLELILKAFAEQGDRIKALESSNPFILHEDVEGLGVTSVDFTAALKERVEPLESSQPRGEEMPNQQTFLTVREFVEALGGRISQSVVYSAIKRGEIPYVTIGRRKLIPGDALTQMLAWPSNGANASPIPRQPEKS
jgi:predicted DNA-binding transcriptional regulator AlpA